MRSVLLIVALASTHSYSLASELKVGEQASSVTMEGDQGARIDGKAWASVDMKGHVTSFFYVDPDERESNEPLEAAYKKEQLPLEQHKSVAVINMAATWIPNAILTGMLEKKQKDFPQTVYVKDFKKTLVSAWQLSDDNINLVVFDKDGKVLILHKGPVPESKIPEIMKTIRAAL